MSVVDSFTVVLDFIRDNSVVSSSLIGASIILLCLIGAFNTRCLIMRQFIWSKYSHTDNYPTNHNLTKSATKIKPFSSIPKVPTDEMVCLMSHFNHPQYIHQYAALNHSKRGPIYRDTMGSPIDILFIADPLTVPSLHKASGKCPGHTVPEQWTAYLKNRGRSRGLFFMNGAEWHTYRRILNKKFLNPNILKPHYNSLGVAADNFLEEIWDEQEKGNLSQNLLKSLYKWALEAIFIVTLGKKSSYFNDEKKFNQFAGSVHQIFHLTTVLTAITPDVAQQQETEEWELFCQTCDYVLDTASDYIRLVISDSRANGPSSDSCLVDELIHSDELDDAVIVRLIADLLLAAVDTTAVTSLWLVYVLGVHSEVTSELREKVQDFKKTKGTEDLLSLEPSDKPELSVIRDLIKETMRLYPVAPFITRLLEHPCEIHGYQIPENTMAIISLFSINRDEKYFDDPLEFKPKRWSSKDEKNNESQKLSSTNSNSMAKLAQLPWGFGNRDCIGKSTAEAQLTIFVLHLVDKFDIVVKNGANIHMKMEMISVPSENLDIEVKKITN